jgi:two-component system sensor histidine kinase ResE
MITASSKKIDHWVVVDIKDQGVGISQEDLPHLFDRFYRADKSRTKVDAPGYGLGLAIAKKIVEAHQGEIKVKSEPGKGTVFTVELPQKQVSSLIS